MSKMKVKDISSFFKPKGGAAPASPTTIEVPARRTKKPKKQEHVEPTLSDEEDPLPRDYRDKKQDNNKGKRKAKVLSDSDDDDDFKTSRKVKKVENREEKKAEVKPEKVKEKEKEKPKKNVDPTDFFSTDKVKQKKPEPKEEKKVKSPVKTEVDKTSEKQTRSESPLKSSKEAESSPKSGRSQGEKIKEESPVKSKPIAESPRSSRSRAEKSEESPKKSKIEMESPKSRPRREVSSSPRKLSESHSPTAKRIKREVTPPPLPKSSPKKQGRAKTPPPSSTSKKDKKKTKASKKDVKQDSDSESDSGKKETKKKPTAKKKSAKKEPKTPPKTSPKKVDTPTTETKKNFNYAKFLQHKSSRPRRLGEKYIPTGTKDCLEGMKFVITGLLESLERDACKDLIERHGGRVMTSVSGVTAYLIVGDDPGESKVKKAEHHSVEMITEDDLLEMIRKSNPDGNNNQDESQFEMMDFDEEPEVKVVEKNKSDKIKQVNTKMESSSNSIPSTSSSSVTKLPPSLMWVDKYRPKMMKQIVGQGREGSNARKLIKWLNNWFKNRAAEPKDAKTKSVNPLFFRDPEGKTYKCALLSGPPGIGKTTTAHLACKEVGYDFFELNASDTRNKRGLHENVADALSCKTMYGAINDVTNKHVLIMDEVDGMSGNEDRGGVQELITLIKGSKVPIICICNDRNHQKIRSLANYCFDLRFTKPTVQELKAFIMSICFKEQIKLESQQLLQLCISTDQDVRQILHQLELYKESNANNVLDPRKDLRFGPWDVCRKVFFKPEHEKMNIHEKTGLFFQDYSFGPLFVQENYPRWNPVRAKGNRCARLELLARTASSIADGDLTDTMIRKTNNWSLLPVQAIFSSYVPGELMESAVIGGVDFPQWLGKNSNKNKRHRLLQSLHTHVHLEVSGSLEALNMDYLSFLRQKICGYLAQEDIDAAAGVMETYSLIREDIESINDVSLWPGMKNTFEKVEPKTKSAFTRRVNKDILPYSCDKLVKKGKGKGTETDMEGFDEDEEGEAAAESEEEETAEKDAMIKIKNKKKKEDTAAKKKTTPKKDESGPSKPKRSRKK